MYVIKLSTEKNRSLSLSAMRCIKGLRPFSIFGISTNFRVISRDGNDYSVNRLTVGKIVTG